MIKCISYFTTLLFLLYCRSFSQPYNSLNQELRKLNISSSQTNTVFFTGDYACNLCQQSLIISLKQLPIEQRVLLYASKSKKLQLNQSIYQTYIIPSNFYVIQNSSLLNEIAEQTQSIPGAYKLLLKNQTVDKIIVIQ